MWVPRFRIRQNTPRNSPPPSWSYALGTVSVPSPGRRQALLSARLPVERDGLRRFGEQSQATELGAWRCQAADSRGLDNVLGGLVGRRVWCRGPEMRLGATSGCSVCSFEEPIIRPLQGGPVVFHVPHATCSYPQRGHLFVTACRRHRPVAAREERIRRLRATPHSVCDVRREFAGQTPTSCLDLFGIGSVLEWPAASACRVVARGTTPMQIRADVWRFLQLACLERCKGFFRI